jgi:2-polyprenyl-3-methyl-5-hydroxy-6-metoxy-1,4-benzoquinol methylase
MENMTENSTIIFHRSGLAALSDLNNPGFQNIFRKLEKDQDMFLRNETEFRSKDYKWPHDPLHTWSRVWEYPYVYYHLEKYFRKLSKDLHPVVADLGSGVTFFPFSIAQMGYHVICMDNDHICEKDMKKAIGCLSAGRGAVEFTKVTSSDLPLEAGTVDVVYSISVLEHIEHFAKTVKEVARIIKSGGLFLLTIDLDLLGNCEISVDNYGLLREILDQYFYYAYPETSVHPADLLVSSSGPYPIRNLSGLELARYLFKQRFINPLLFKRPRPAPTAYKLAVSGVALTRR